MPSYAQLKDDIPDWLEDHSPEILDKVPQFIMFGEGRCARELEVRHFNGDVSGAFGVAQYLVPMPRMEVMRSFEVVSNGDTIILEKRDREWLKVYWPNANEVDTPKYYSVQNATQFIVAPSPSLAIPYTIYFRQRLPALSDTNQENWLTSEDGYDALLYASLAYAATFVLSDKRDTLKANFEAEWERAKNDINSDEAQVMRDAERQPGVLQANV